MRSLQRTNSGELIYIYENFVSYGRSIYTMETGKHYKSELFFQSFSLPEISNYIS